MTQADLLLLDAENRQRALELASFIVEAPAGAGKTELLTQRYLKLLAVVNEPEEIVAITFTNKAAAEMRSRILDSLQRAAVDEIPDAAHKKITFELAQKALARSAERGWNLLEQPARLRINTIDSLCSYLARQLPILSRFGGQPGVVEDASLHCREAARRALAALEDEAGQGVVAEALKHFDNDTIRLGALLAQMLAKRDQWLHHAGNVQGEIAGALHALVGQEISRAAALLTPALQARLMPLARFAASNLDCSHPIALLLDWETPIPPKPEALPLWRSVCDLLLTGSGDYRKALNKNQGFPADDAGRQQKEQLLSLIAELPDPAPLARIRVLPDPQSAEEQRIVAALARLLQVAAAHLLVVFQEAGEVDFVEIASRALQALEDERGATELALQLDYRIQHLLVDEFQDTSPAQVNLLEKLTAGWVPGDGRTLFCVGDPMQSIYRFRKADVGLFLGVAESGIGDLPLEKLHLTRNNRSCPAVVDWVNTAFATVFPAQDDNKRGAIKYRPFVAATASPSPAGGRGVGERGSRDALYESRPHPPSILRHAQNSGQAKPLPEGEGDADSLREKTFDEGVFVHPLVLGNSSRSDDMAGEEARLLAELIIQERAQFPQANMAVLVRARSHLEALVAEIRSRYPDHPSLKFQAVEIEQLSGRQTVQDIHALTSALCHRADRVHWLAILRAPWCGLTLADLHALAADDHHSNIWQLMQDETRVVRLSADGQQRLRHVREVIAEAYAHQGRQSLRRWVESVWLMLGGPQCLWDAGDVRDVQAFLGLLDDMTTLDAALLQTRMEKLFAAPDVQADGYLQFMTIHKSKGLEFDSVILPGLHRSSRNNDAQLLLWDEIPVEGAHSQLVAAPFVPKHKRDDATTGYEYLQGLERERDANESARVLYVAATRTRQRLHLVAAIKQDSEGHIKAPANTLLDLLWDSVEGEFLSAESRDVLPSPLQGEGQDGGGNLLASYPHLQCAPALARTGRSAGDQHADRNPCFTPSPPPEKGREFVPSLIRLPRPTVPILLGAECSMPLPGPPVLPEAREEVASLEASCGTLAHLYMEMFARQGAAQWPIERLQGLLPAMQRWFGRQGHTEQECNDGARRVLQALTTTLASESGQWVLQAHPQAASEWALATVENGQVRQHVIDRTFVADGVRWIVDYKSARLGMASNVAAEAYRPQLERYARLFRDEGLPVRKAVFFLASGKLVEIEE